MDWIRQEILAKLWKPYIEYVRLGSNWKIQADMYEYKSSGSEFQEAWLDSEFQEAWLDSEFQEAWLDSELAWLDSEFQKAWLDSEFQNALLDSELNIWRICLMSFIWITILYYLFQQNVWNMILH